MALKDLAELIEITSLSLTMTPAAELAQMAAHEYDAGEDVIVPPPGSPGEKFLREGARSFSRWIQSEGRFPQDDEEVRRAATDWHRQEVTGSVTAQAFVDLGLFYSHHADTVGGASIHDLRRVLDAAAEALAFTLLEEYGPMSG